MRRISCSLTLLGVIFTVEAGTSEVIKESSRQAQLIIPACLAAAGHYE